MTDHPEIKKLRAFIVHSDEFQSKNVIFAYYLKAYACQKLYSRI